MGKVKLLYGQQISKLVGRTKGTKAPMMIVIGAFAIAVIHVACLLPRSSATIHNTHFRTLNGCERNFILSSNAFMERSSRSVQECLSFCGPFKYCTSVNVIGDLCKLISMDLDDYENQQCTNLSSSSGSRYLTKVIQI